jgi:YlmC/YmxH family sporulation protein
MRICALRQKEVINICTCKRLGFISDIEFDLCSGCICAIVVPGMGKFWGMWGRCTEYVIPFRCICKVGDDIILVEVKEEEVLVESNGESCYTKNN